MTTTFRRLGALALLAVAAPAGAQAFEDLGQLEMVVAAALGAGIGEPGGASRPLDRRLKLKACPEPAVIGPPALGAVAVSCPSVGWRIRVPLVYTPRAAVQTLAHAAPAEPIVRKGDQIELTASSGAFTVSTVAVAEQDGVPGARIRVRSEGRKGAVIGVVMEDGRVSLPGFK